MKAPLINTIKGIGVEVGVWKGHGAEAILTNQNVKRVYLVDPYEKAEEFTGCNLKPTGFIFEDQWKYKVEAIEKTMKYSDRAFFVFARSTEAAKTIEDELDFVYIDANHNYEFVKEDIETWYPKLKSGGILSGHDYPTPSVAKAVNEFMSINHLKLEATTPDWYCYKK